MRNYLSLFTLFIKRSFGKISALFLIMTACEFTVFIHNLNSGNITKNELMSGFGNEYLLGIEYILKQNKSLTVILVLSFILLTLILCLTGCEFSNRQGYTLRRLNVTEKKLLLIQSVYGAIVYGLLMMLQAIIFYILCNIYVSFAEGHENAFEGLISNQTILLAFYRSNLLHAFMPLDDIFKHISNLIMITALGFSTASFSYLSRRKKFPFETVLLVPVIIINFASDWTELTYELVIIGMSLFVIGSLTARLSVEGQAYDK